MSLEKKLEENAEAEEAALQILDHIRRERRALVNSCTHIGGTEYVNDPMDGLLTICKICKRAI